MDAVKKYNPSPKLYFYSAEILKASAIEIMLVAAHGWVIAGKASAGM